MITYEVTATVDAAIAERYERFMCDTHIPNILATGCFTGVDLERAGPGRFRVRYQAATREDLERYMEEHTARLRAQFAAQFPTGAQLSREIWTTVAEWQGSGRM